MASIVDALAHDVVAVDGIFDPRSCSIPTELRRDSNPPAVPACPDVGVAARSLAPVQRHECGSSVNDREITHQPNIHVVRLEILDLGWLRCALQKAGPIDERAIRKGTKKIVRQNLLEPLDVGILNRADVFAIQFEKDVEIRCRGGLGLHRHSPVSMMRAGALRREQIVNESHGLRYQILWPKQTGSRPLQSS